MLTGCRFSHINDVMVDIHRQTADGWQSVDGTLSAAMCTRTARVRCTEFPWWHSSAVSALHLSGQRPTPESSYHRGTFLRWPHRQRRNRQHHTVHNAAGCRGVRCVAARRRHCCDDRVRIHVTFVQLVLAIFCASECGILDVGGKRTDAAVSWRRRRTWRCRKNLNQCRSWSLWRLRFANLRRYYVPAKLACSGTALVTGSSCIRRVTK